LAAALLALRPGRLRLTFALATLPALLGVLVVALRVREGGSTAAVNGTTAAAGRGQAPPLPRSLRWPLAAIFLFALGNASDPFLLLRLAGLGVTALGLPLLWSAFHVLKWACSAPAGRLADRLGPARPLVAGWVLYALVYGAFARWSRPVPLLAIFAV